MFEWFKRLREKSKTGDADKKQQPKPQTRVYRDASADYGRKAAQSRDREIEKLTFDTYRIADIDRHINGR